MVGRIVVQIALNHELRCIDFLCCAYSDAAGNGLTLQRGVKILDSRTSTYIYHYCLRVDYIDVSCQAMETTKALCPSPARSFGRSIEICELAWNTQNLGGL